MKRNISLYTTYMSDQVGNYLQIIFGIALILILKVVVLCQKLDRKMLKGCI